jgi:hypothetical protein
MSPFDPTEVRQAVAEFTPSRPQKFQDLFPAKEVISELRRKRASYRAIAELLTKHCLPTSKTAIAMFCHEILAEMVRPRRRPNRKPVPVRGASNGKVPMPPVESPTTGNPVNKIPAKAEEIAAVRTRGPRIANVRMLQRPIHETP